MPEIGLNKVILVGRTGADAEIKYTVGGKAVADFSLAIKRNLQKRRWRAEGPRPVGGMRRLGKARGGLWSVPDQGDPRVCRRQAADA